ncbi:MAG TPA: hypothetical protein VIM55_05510 [Mucilaginibacter sp.]
MTIDQERYEKKLSRQINTFSSRLMSNAKWLKLFKVLCDQPELAVEGYAIDIFNLKPWWIDLSSTEKFDQNFNSTGIKDVLPGGPLKFKEIRWIEFHLVRSKSNILKNRNGERVVSDQNLNKIKGIFSSLGEFEIEESEDMIKLYGYK